MTLPLFLKGVDHSFWEVRVENPVKSWAGKLEEVLEAVEGPARLVGEVEDTEVRPNFSLVYIVYCILIVLFCFILLLFLTSMAIGGSAWHDNDPRKDGDDGTSFISPDGEMYLEPLKGSKNTDYLVLPHFMYTMHLYSVI